VEPNQQHISKQVAPTEAVKPTKSKPKGDLVIPALICGFVGIVLTTILSLINRYKGVDQMLKEKYIAEPFLMKESIALHNAWNWLLVLIVCYGISFAVLDSDKIWRRVMLFFLALVIVVMGSPVLMLWDVFWSPMMVLVGLIWSWVCAFIYSVQHIMPCELLAPPSKKIKQPKPSKQPKPVKPAKIKKSKKEVKPVSEAVSTSDKPIFIAPIAKGKPPVTSDSTDSTDSVPFAETDDALTTSLNSNAKFQPKK